MKKTGTVTVESEGACRACGVRILIGYTSMRGKEAEPFALHDSPPCEKFLHTETLEFLQWSRMGDA